MLLWEIAPDGAEVRELRARLGLDSGYVSCVLRSLEQQRLIVVRPSADDARVRRVELAPEGLVERPELDRRSGYVEVEPFNDEPCAHHWFAKRLV